MWYIVLALLALLCLFGLLELAGLVSQKLLARGSCTPSLIIIPVSGHVEDIEYFLRSLLHERQWGGALTCKQIILADMGMDEETLRICKLFCENRTDVLLQKGEDVLCLLQRSV